MTPPTVEISVAEINAGDEFLDDRGNAVWTAKDDAVGFGVQTHLNVQFPDGGIGTRVWDDHTTRIRVVRAAR